MAAFDGHSIKFESAEYLTQLGSLSELKQMSALMPTRLEFYDHHSFKKQQLRMRIACSRLPDPAYKAVNHALTFNLSLEPAFAFNLATFADRLIEDHIVSGRTSLRLQDSVLYLESDSKRFEICKRPQATDAASLLQPQGVTKFRLSRVPTPLMKDNAYMAKARRPLDESTVQVISGELDWSDFVWGEGSLIVRGAENGGDLVIAPLKNYKYYTISY
jgi:hypothetical protein